MLTLRLGFPGQAGFLVDKLEESGVGRYPAPGRTD
jgi:hypothetical protein